MRIRTMSVGYAKPNLKIGTFSYTRPQLQGSSEGSQWVKEAEAWTSVELSKLIIDDSISDDPQCFNIWKSIFEGVRST